MPAGGGIGPTAQQRLSRPGPAPHPSHTSHTTTAQTRDRHANSIQAQSEGRGLGQGRGAGAGGAVGKGRMLSGVGGAELSDLEKRYELCNIIGEGTYGVVYQALQKGTGKKVALKKIRLDNPDLLEEIGVPGTAIREIILLRELDHPNIVALLEVTHVDLQLWLVFEFCHNDLKHFIKQHTRQRKEMIAQLNNGQANGPPPPNSQSAIGKGFSSKTTTAMAPLTANSSVPFGQGNGDSGPVGPRKTSLGLPAQHCKHLIYQLLSGIAYCHGRRILHRDLKPQNLLIDETGTVLKIADFGLARTFTPPTKPKTQEVVTLWYRAPELLLGDKCYGASVDIWSVGCIMAELVGGRPLFPGDSEIDTLFKIFKLIGTPCSDNWPGAASLSHYQTEFPRWVRNKKSSLRQLLFELDSDGLDLLSRLLEYIPANRITASEALQHPWLRGVAER